jgi:hypothetical protein
MGRKTTGGMRVCCTLLVVALRAPLVQAQEPAVVHVRPSVIIDIVGMDDASRAEVIRALATFASKAENLNQWSTVTVQANENLFSIVARAYRYSDGRYRETARAIAEIVRDANGLVDISSVRVGQRLKLPPLPKRPYDFGSSPTFAQVSKLGEKSRTARVADVLATGEVTRDVDPRLGTTYITPQLGADEVGRLLELLPASVKDRVRSRWMYVGPLSETASLVPAGGAAACAAANLAAAHDPGGRVRLPPASRPEQPALKYYILDFFNRKDASGCSHGDSVFSVAQRTLQESGVAGMSVDIQKVDLDFYNPANRDNVQQVMAGFAHSYSQDVEAQLLAQYNVLRQKVPAPEPDGSIRVPLLYIAAIQFNLLHDPATCVISSSYYTRSDGFDWLPKDYRPDSSVVLVNAVLDSDSWIENSTNSKIEPISSYWMLRKTLGVILVGAEESPGKPFGMFSQDGDGVSCLAPGFGWGAACLAKGGTSLATPVVATQLLIAEDFWRRQQKKIDAREARLRLLLSSEINPAYAGKYASAGVPQLPRLLRTDGAFAVKKDGAIVSVEIGKGSRIEYEGLDGLLHGPFLRRTADPSDEVWGVQVVGSTIYVFRERDMKWFAVTKPVIHVTLSVAGNAPVTYDTIDAFAADFKGVVVI